ncbi:hypothetical protein [Streptomyces daliensis]
MPEGEHKESWQRLIDQAGRPRGDSGTSMALASSDGGEHREPWLEGPESGGVRSEKAAWSRAGEGVGSLRKNIGKSLTELERGQKGLGPGSDTGNVESATAQREVYRSWKRYLGDVDKRCDLLQDRLEKAGGHFYKNDQAIKAAFGRLGDRYEDTSPVGGRHRRG